MMNVHTLCIASLFSLLSVMTACEKIDASDFPAPDKEQSNQTSPEGNGGSNGEAGGNTGQGGVTGVVMLEVLEDGTLWLPVTEHVTALTAYDKDCPEKILLVSLYEWHDISSAASATNSTQALDIARHYNEGGVCGWRIPTKEEGKMLREVYYGYTNEAAAYFLSDELLTLNKRITSLGGTEIRAWQKKDSAPSYRYLCNDAAYTFSLLKASNTTKAGAKTKYNLRLVKDSVIMK